MPIEYRGINVESLYILADQTLTDAERVAFTIAKDTFIAAAKGRLSAKQRSSNAIKPTSLEQKILKELNIKIDNLEKHHAKTAQHISNVHQLQTLAQIIDSGGNEDTILVDILLLLPDLGSMSPELEIEKTRLHMLSTNIARGCKVDPDNYEARQALFKDNAKVRPFIERNRKALMLKNADTEPNPDTEPRPEIWHKTVMEYLNLAKRANLENSKSHLGLLCNVIARFDFEVNNAYVSGLAVGYLLNLFLSINTMNSTNQEIDAFKKIVMEHVNKKVTQLKDAPSLDSIAAHEYKTKKTANCCLPLFQCHKVADLQQRLSHKVDSEQNRQARRRFPALLKSRTAP